VESREKPYYYAAMKVTMDLATTLQLLAVSPDYEQRPSGIFALRRSHARLDFHAAAQSFFWDWICSVAVTYDVWWLLPQSASLGDTVSLKRGIAV
jgi:hypothetical protein